MAKKSGKQKSWLRSGEVRKELKISSCTLAHFREDGEIKFKKEGNAFLYSESDVKKINDKRSRQ